LKKVKNFIFVLTFAPGIEIMDLNNWERQPETSNKRIYYENV